MKPTINENGEIAFGSAVASVGLSIDGDETPVRLTLESSKAEKNVGRAEYSSDDKSIEAETTAELFGETVRQKSRVTAKSVHTLTSLTAATVHGICRDEEGILDRLCDGSIVIHYCINRWQGEGQWRTATPEDLGLYAASCHGWEKSYCRFESVSSWSTGTYYPLFILEDKKKGESFFCECEGGQSWFVEFFGYGGDGIKSLSVRMGGADERLGFAKKMNAGDSYESPSAIYGFVRGGFEEAVRELTRFKRADSLAACGAPLVFNDYMNCNWTNECRATLLPLIDAAADAGAEIFCLDDGWQVAQGIWTPADSKFRDGKPDGCLGDIFAHIKSRGMGIGVWFEFETVPIKVAEMLGADDCYLFRNDAMVAPNRPLANMRSPKLIAYLRSCVDDMYARGVRFIKNDHNNTEHIGSTLYGESAGEGLQRNNAAFLEFIDGIRAKYPDLLIENCASGAMRSDHGTLRHFNIQSTSDQEDYLANPSVLSGSLAQMPPEKAGIWSYPYPLSFDNRKKLDLTDKEAAQYISGEQAVFNMVNGLMGCLYLSGKIHRADKSNFALIKEGCALYKELRPFVRTSYPVFPCGMIRLHERTAHSVGLLGEKGDKLVLAVWNLSDKARKVKTELGKYGLSTCRILYPSAKEGVKFTYSKGTLECDFARGRSARLFVLEK